LVVYEYKSLTSYIGPLKFKDQAKKRLRKIKLVNILNGPI